MATTSRNVLYLQSNGVHGSVGCRVGMFVLQLLGYDVSHICTGQISNSPSFEVYRVIDHMRGDDLALLYEGLKLNDFKYTHVLSGYMGTAELIKKSVEIIKDIKEQNTDIQYFCDPIMGENGVLYVEPGVVDVFKEQLIYLADVISPNQFELSLLSGIEIREKDDLMKALDTVHEKGVKTIVLTSTCLGSDETLLTTAVSSVKDGQKERYILEYPRLPFAFVGTGDVFISCFLVWLDKFNVKVALEKSVSTMQCILKRTVEAAQAEVGPGKTPSPKQMELRVIQSQRDIESPPDIFTARKLD